MAETKSSVWKTLGICASIVIPLISIGIGLGTLKSDIIASVTKVDTKVDVLKDKVEAHDSRLDKIEIKLDMLNNKVDTVQLRQHDEMLLSIRRYRFPIRSQQATWHTEHVNTPGGQPTLQVFKPLANK